MRGSYGQRRAARRRGRRGRLGMASAVVRASVLLATVLALVDVGRMPPESPDPLAVREGERLLVVAPHPGRRDARRRPASSSASSPAMAARTSCWSPPATATSAASFSRPACASRRRPTSSRTASAALPRPAPPCARSGRPADALDVLGFPDGALMPLLSRHWRRAEPARSATTGASDPPYAFAVDPDITYDGADLRNELARVLDEVRPTIIALPDPLDRHPDHGASGVFTILAIDEWIGGRWPRREPPRVAQLPGALARLAARLGRRQRRTPPMPNARWRSRRRCRRAHSTPSCSR